MRYATWTPCTPATLEPGGSVLAAYVACWGGAVLLGTLGLLVPAAVAAALAILICVGG